MVTKGPECWCLGFPKAVSNFLLYSQSLLEERLIAWRMLLSFECFLDETAGICDSLRSRARSGQSWGQTWCLEPAVFLFSSPLNSGRRPSWAWRWEHSQCCLALGDLRELSLNMEPHLRGFPGSFCKEMCLQSLWKGSTLKKWHINAATWQVMKQFPHFQIPEYLLLPAWIEMED